MKLPPLLSSLVQGRVLTCASCGREFTCGPFRPSCWCSKIQLTPEARGALRERFDDCLCPACLERASAGRRP